MANANNIVDGTNRILVRVSIQASQYEVMIPQITLAQITSKGVSEPRSNPIIPLLCLKGKKINNCTKIGPTL